MGSTCPVRTKTPEPTVDPTPMQSRSIKFSLESGHGASQGVGTVNVYRCVLFIKVLVDILGRFI